MSRHHESWAWFTFCWQEIYRAIGINREDRIFTASARPFVGFWAGYEAAQQIGALAIPAGHKAPSKGFIGSWKRKPRFFSRPRPMRSG